MQYIMLILKFLPAVLEAIAAIEKIMSSAPGDAKKAMIVETVKQTAAAAGQGMPEADAKVLSSVVDSAVAVANRFGVLGKVQNVKP